MLDTGSPLQDEGKVADSVAPLSTFNASRSSSPGICSAVAHGSARRLSFPTRPHSAPPPAVEMAINLLPLPDRDRAPTHSPDEGVGDHVPMPEEGIPPCQPEPESSKMPPADEQASPRPAQLTELAHLLRLQKYHKRRCHQSRQQLHSLQIAAARTSRLARAAHSVQYTLAECVKFEDKDSFVNLFNAFQDACDDCLCPGASAGSELEDEPTDLDAVCFFENLSSSSSVVLLGFLDRLRHDGAFIARRLAALTQKELVAVLPDRKTSRSGQSIFGASLRSSSRGSRPLGFVVDSQVDQLSCRGYGSPLEALVFAPTDIGSADSSQEDRMTGVWATVCCTLISEQKPGSEKVVPAVLDLWSALCPWPGKERLEIWILQTLQNCSALLEQSTKQTFRSRVEGKTDAAVEYERRADEFYNQAAMSLLELFGDRNGASVIPPGAMKLCHAIWDRLGHDPGRQSALPQFVATRWLFSSFMPNVITLPEAHGILTDHYLSDVLRQRILRDITVRAQKFAFEVAYSWKSGNPVPLETSQRVHAVTARFQGRQPSESLAHSVQTDSTLPARPSTTETFLAVSVNDLTMLLNALYPQRRPASISSDVDHLRSGLQSSASSISGFSLFRNARPGDGAYDPPDVLHGDSLGLDLSSQELDQDTSGLCSAGLREACVELEEFATSRATGTREYLEVLVVPAGSGTPCTLQHKFTSLVSRDLVTKVASDPDLGSTSPLRRSLLFSSCKKAIETLLQRDLREPMPQLVSLDSSPGVDWSHPVLMQVRELFEQAILASRDQSDFVGAHHWFSQLRDLESLVQDCGTAPALYGLLSEIERTARSSIVRAEALHHACELWYRGFASRGQTQSQQLMSLARMDTTRLRDKMWYVADVRTSAAYDQARSIAAALRIMGRPKRTSRTGLAPPLRHWSGSKLFNNTIHLKTEAQILEILSARPEQGGPNKLSDDQSRTTAAWLETNDIDRICIGEERLHKLCMEVRRCVDIVTADQASESSKLMSNALFAREPSLQPRRLTSGKPPSFSNLGSTVGQSYMLPLRANIKSTDTLSSASQTLSSMSSRDFVDSRSPTLTHSSSVPFWSPTLTEADSSSSATSVGSSMTLPLGSSRKRYAVTPTSVPNMLEKLRERTTSLLLSELTTNLFNEGSETDRAFWTGLGWELVQRHFRTLQTIPHGDANSGRSGLDARQSVFGGVFSFEDAFATILQKFAAVTSPFAKMACLYDIDRLLVPYMAERSAAGDGRTSNSISLRATEESGLGKSGANSDAAVQGFRHLFSKTPLRPPAIFRDLQYIASLVPASILHDTAQGRAFSNAAVAISQLKREARIIMVETADSIIAYHSNNRGHGQTSSLAQQQRDSATFAPSRAPSAEDVSRYEIADAGYLLQITAKEGDAVAQRELATLYLTHPELMDRIIAPLARPRDVFKQELESKWRKNQDPNRCDPTTMCVAHHWMSLSSSNGDALAKEYLRQREEMDRLGS